MTKLTEQINRLKKLMNLTEDVQQSDKQDFRNTLSVMLQAPNSPRSIYGEEQLAQTINNAFTYSTRGTVKKTYSVNVSIYKSKNGTRYLVEEDGDILCAAFVDNDNNITGIITDMGYTNVGIGTNLTNLIKKLNPSAQFGGVASKEGQKLISRTQ